MKTSIDLGLIGYPLGHSLSPKIHTTALKLCGLEGDYSLFQIHPDDQHGLENLLARIPNLDAGQFAICLLASATVKSTD